MDEHWQRRLCDFVAGAAGAGALVALVVGAWRGVVLCLAVVVVVQLMRAAT